jgi:hypothetical protein
MIRVFYKSAYVQTFTFPICGSFLFRLVGGFLCDLKVRGYVVFWLEWVFILNPYSELVLFEQEQGRKDGIKYTESDCLLSCSGLFFSGNSVLCGIS